MFRRVLVPVDPAQAEASAAAVKAAANIVKRDKAEATILAVQRLVSKASVEIDQFEAFVQDQSAALGVKFTGAVRVGEFVGRTIAECADQGDFDLVVMTSHDPSAFDFLTGSHASSTVLHAPCSVLIVRGRS